MATTIGKLDEFKSEVETITTYLERVEVFFAANGVTDAKKSAVLLSCVGSKTSQTSLQKSVGWLFSVTLAPTWTMLSAINL